MSSSLGGLTRVPSRFPTWSDAGEQRAVAGAAQPAPQPTHGRFLEQRLRVLLVEDEPGDALLVKYALKQSAQPTFSVLHVATLAAAIDVLTVDPALDVVLLDLSLPDSKGLSTVSRVQAVAPKVPIVIMTGLDDPQFADKALEAGAQDYLVKGDEAGSSVVRAIRYAITRMGFQVERDTLAERLAAQQRILMAELAAARAMQFDLLPRQEAFDTQFKDLGLQIEAAFEPSSGIGGDLWGCIDCGEGRVAFYAFDFSGHGIGAALNVFRLHTLIADHWSLQQEPSDLLHALNIALKGLLIRGQFATMFFGILDTARGEVEWSSAGSPPPILVQDGKARFLDSKGVPLGLTKAAQYPTHRTPFGPGSTLIVYSDAITDAVRIDGAPFTEAGLLEAVEDRLGKGYPLTIEALIDHFLSMVRQPLADDLTALRITRLRG